MRVHARRSHSAVLAASPAGLRSPGQHAATMNGNSRPDRSMLGAITAAAPRRVLPEPSRQAPMSLPYHVVVTGVGGTGVITVSVVLAMAAHLEGKGALAKVQSVLLADYGPVIALQPSENNCRKDRKKP